MKHQGMVKNYFYLVVGILCVLFAGTQTWDGLQTISPVLHDSNIDSSTLTVFTYQWFIIIAEQLVFGIALIAMAFQKNMEKVRIVGWVIMAALFIRGLVIVVVTVSLGIGSITNLLTSTIVIFILVILLLLGVRVTDK